ncbi:MAG: peptidoglycan-associated lipoprotein Pal [Gemmatimonadetes bacterium]|nr:peptidoglycan-associated lipoprotein Pal [Gemmatimonadota bacterium]
MAAALIALSTVAACGRRPAPAPVAAPTATPTAATTGDNSAAAREAEERARREADEARRRDEIARARAILATTVYFDFDSYSIREDSRRLLDEKSPVVRADPSIRLLIAGHTDERGSTEYNLALGMRRAEAVREYLTNFGVDPGRLEVTSFGEERPVDSGADEASWSRNRRVEFEVTSGPAAR